MSKALVKFDAPELEMIGTSKAKQIKETFVPMAEMLAEFEDRFDGVIAEAEEEITKAVTVKAKSLRIAISKVRIETEKLRKEQKEEYLRAGKAIDGVSNILKWAVTDKEDKLRGIEQHFEGLERERLTALQAERVEKISPYLEDAHEREFASMDEEVWSAYFAAKKKEFTDRVAAEKQAEADRVERERVEAEERERIRKENEQLRQEAEERDRQVRAESEKREEAALKVQKAHEEQLRIEREERERAEKVEREKREKVEAELQAKKEAEAKAKEAEEAQIQADLNRGDADKVLALVADLESLKTKYTFKSAKNRKMYSALSPLIDNVISHTRR